jgi:hypothetical protein
MIESLDIIWVEDGATLSVRANLRFAELPHSIQIIPGEPFRQSALRHVDFYLGQFLSSFVSARTGEEAQSKSASPLADQRACGRGMRLGPNPLASPQLEDNLHNV